MALRSIDFLVSSGETLRLIGLEPFVGDILYDRATPLRAAIFPVTFGKMKLGYASLSLSY